MNANEIPQADLLDILFEGRNKEYGAYDLRKFYNERLTRAILMTLSLCLLLIFGYILAGKLEKPPAFRGQILGPTVLIPPPPPIEKAVVPPPPPPAAHRTPPPQVATIIASIPRIVPNDQVDPNEKPHTIEEMDHATLGTANRMGVPDDRKGPFVPSTGGGTGLLTAPVQKDNSGDSAFFFPIENEAYYKGGPKAWIRFLMKNCNTPQEALEKGIQGKVIVQFMVDELGNISEVQAISGPEELKGEAVRVIKKSDQWVPALQNGRHVRSYKKQPLVFTLVGDEG
jgi:periplasmic protein TonB